jgi:hypothetical protein
MASAILYQKTLPVQNISPLHRRQLFRIRDDIPSVKRQCVRSGVAAWAREGEDNRLPEKVSSVAPPVRDIYAPFGTFVRYA